MGGRGDGFCGGGSAGGGAMQVVAGAVVMVAECSEMVVKVEKGHSLKSDCIRNILRC